LKIYGNITGLKPGIIKRLQRLYTRKIPPQSLVSSEICDALSVISAEINRQIGIIVDRRGKIGWVVAGENHRIILPDIGRARASFARLRGLRFIHTHLNGEALTHDDLTDLRLLSFDAVAAIAVDKNGDSGAIHIAHLLPGNSENRLWEVLPPVACNDIGIDFTAFIRELESEFTRTAGRAREIKEKERAIIIFVLADRKRESAFEIAELKELCRTAGVFVEDTVVQFRGESDRSYVIGKGKLEDVVLRGMQKGVDLLIFSCNLTPSQVRAIGNFTELRVIDRTQLILDIFAQRARSSDGKLQVELAQLRYALPRLIEKDTALSRLTGGIGGRGPGETKLEISRRRARDRIKLLEREIERISRQRMEQRKRRREKGIPVASLIGYTNAGKSTLFNTLTRSSVLVEDKLFATLDPTSRRLRLPDGRDVILTDTVGFIRDIPEDLMAAFRATFEELNEASVLVHVVDASNPDAGEHIESVKRILSELGLAGVKTLLVLNKTDLIDENEIELRKREFQGIPMSALSRGGAADLLDAIRGQLPT